MSKTETETKRPRGRPPKPPTDRAATIRRVRMTEALWTWCSAQGNASDYIRALIERDRLSRA